MSSVDKDNKSPDDKNQRSSVSDSNDNININNDYAEDSALIDLIDIDDDTSQDIQNKNTEKHIKGNNMDNRKSRNNKEGKHYKQSNKKSAKDVNKENGSESRKQNPLKSKPVPKAIPKNLIAIVSFSIILVILIAVTAGHIYFKNRWYINTTLNGTNVENVKLSQSISDFEKLYNDYTLTLSGRNDMSTVITKDDIDLSIESDNCIKNEFDKQHSQFYIFALLQPQELEVTPTIEYSEEKLNNILDNCLLVKGDDENPIIGPKDAGSEFSDEKGYFVVRAEIEGNTINKDMFTEAVKDALTHTISEVNLDDEEKYPNMFAAPEIKAEGSGLQETCDAYNNTVIHWINWKMADDVTVSVTPQDVMAWYDMDDSYNLTLNQTKVENWTEKFCLKYKTVGQTRDFKAHTGNVIKVSGGDYGWQMDYEKTVKQVLDILNADNTEKIQAYLKDNSEENRAALTNNLDAIYLSKGTKFDAANPTNDYGTQNYSEISIDEQVVYVYKDGQLAYTAHCITGLPIPSKETTKGCWYIKEKLRHKTLVGEGYQTPVSYWARITWSGIGYHDATWQSWGSWSPSSYKSVGSHGCINLSLTDVAKIYDLINVGDPVFIY